LFYNGLSLFIILWILCILLRMRTKEIVSSDTFLTIMGWGLILLGLLIITLTFRRINLYSFLGISQNEESEGLITEGVYQIVRHPLYFGLFLFLVGSFLNVPTQSVLFSVVMSVFYIIIGIEFEEKKLRRLFGAEYDQFALNKKKFIPFIY
jgi:methanethiol S-methyltransferase